MPQNCDKVNVPRVNGEIWHKLKENKVLKNRDLRFMNIQRAIVGGAAAVISIMQALTDGSKTPNQSVTNPAELFKTGIHALELLGHANYELSIRRKESMRPVLKQEYATALCGSDLPVTQFLFGDDLSKALREAKQMVQAGRDAGRKSTNFRHAKNWKGHNPNWHKNKQQKWKKNKKGQFKDD